MAVRKRREKREKIFKFDISTSSLVQVIACVCIEVALSFHLLIAAVVKKA